MERPRKSAKLDGISTWPWRVVLKGRHVHAAENLLSVERLTSNAAVFGFVIEINDKGRAGGGRVAHTSITTAYNGEYCRNRPLGSSFIEYCCQMGRTGVFVGRGDESPRRCPQIPRKQLETPGSPSFGEQVAMKPPWPAVGLNIECLTFVYPIFDSSMMYSDWCH